MTNTYLLESLFFFTFRVLNRLLGIFLDLMFAYEKTLGHYGLDFRIKHKMPGQVTAQ